MSFVFILSHIVTFLFFPSSSLAQFVYPPPLPSDQSLSSYASGDATTNLTFAAGDSLFGGFKPSSVPLFVIYRCIQPPNTNTVNAPNVTITSSEGISSPDGTWIWSWTFTNFAFTNAFSPGQNILYFNTFQAPNATVGSLCWFELSTGAEGQQQNPPFDRFVQLDPEDSRTRFLSIPFTVTPPRADGETTTWTSQGNASSLAPGAIPGFTISENAPDPTSLTTTPSQTSGAVTTGASADATKTVSSGSSGPTSSSTSAAFRRLQVEFSWLMLPVASWIILFR